MWPDGKRFTTVHELKKSIILQLVSHSQVECFWCKPSIIWHFHLESSCCWVPETSIVSSCRMSWNEHHCNPAINVVSLPVKYQILTINHYYLLHIPWQQSSPHSKVHGANMGPTGPRWAPCWPHEACYLSLHWSLSWNQDLNKIVHYHWKIISEIPSWISSPCAAISLDLLCVIEFGL